MSKNFCHLHALLGTDGGSQGSNPHNCSSCHRLSDRGNPFDWVLGPRTIVGHVFGEYHAPCTLRTSFVDLKKKSRRIIAARKTKFFVSIQISMLFQWQSKVVEPVDSSLTSFLYSFCILLNRHNIAEKLLSWR